MAKAKQAAVVEEVGFGGGDFTTSSVPPLSEIEDDGGPVDVVALLQENERLRGLLQENEKLRLQQVANSQPVAEVTGPLPEEDPAWPRFLVQVKDAPSWVVRAPNQGYAFEAYKRASGMISTIYPPQVSRSDAPVGRVNV